MIYGTSDHISRFYIVRREVSSLLREAQNNNKKINSIELGLSFQITTHACFKV